MSSSDKDNSQNDLPVLPWQRTKAKHVSDLVSGILSDVVKRRSGMSLDLLAGWDDIVGPSYADFTLPEKILWPKRMSDAEPFKAGTLVVACDGTKALFFQHETDQTLERVNFFFGFEAINKIKLVQKPIKKPKPKQAATVRLNAKDEERLKAVLEQIEDPKLRMSLEKFGHGVISRAKTRKGT
ncbi:MAG: DciA family protein [Salaquimonas sp.]